MSEFYFLSSPSSSDAYLLFIFSIVNFQLVLLFLFCFYGGVHGGSGGGENNTPKKSDGGGGR